jgi:hypothetical protein
MNDNQPSPAQPVDYKGRQINLTSDQREDGTWVCHYSITEERQTQLTSGKGQTEGGFPSREAAELAALEKAKTVIDLRTISDRS